MPFSKRVNEAAESLLSALFSTVGTFPQASGPSTTSCRLTESTISMCFTHYITGTSPNLLLSIAEVTALGEHESIQQKVEQGDNRIVTDPPPILTFFTDSSGLRHLWSWKPRFIQASLDEHYNKDEGGDSKTPRPKKELTVLKSILENVPPKRLLDSESSPFTPKTSEKVPLVKS